MFRIETLNGWTRGVPLTPVGINIRVNSTTRGKLFLSTPGPDEHPRSAPFDFKHAALKILTRPEFVKQDLAPLGV
jgi:hypothetical protein